MKSIVGVLGLLFFFQLHVFAVERREYTITEVSEAPKINGELDDAVWKQCRVAEDFTQTIPNTDQPSRYRSEVRMCYTNDAIYIGATLYQPQTIGSRQLTARDMLYNIHSDIFAVYLDPYDDHQNGFAFRVSSAGVQHDERLSGGVENGDQSWDAVWTSRVTTHSDYWQVEIEIPFSAIRFSQQADKKWGINFYRSIRKLNESSYWNPINVQKQGFLAQTGQLSGLNHINPPVRLFVYPYLSTGYLQQMESDVVSKRWLRSGGADIKVGLSESFTLDMTLVPDFSQVISDNLIRNLSPFEQLLTENRPFFTEGTELFNKAALFYSRRIGGTPSGYQDVQNTYGDHSRYIIEKNPNVSMLYNAFKISGRTKGKLGVGIFNAVGAPMYARVKDKQSGEQQEIQTEPLTNYNMVVLDQALNGQSSFNFTNTNVWRKGSSRDANVSSLILTRFNRKESYSLTLISKWSMVNGNEASVGSAQGIVLAKTSGKFNGSFSSDWLSPRFDKTDMGVQFDFNNSRQVLSLNYNENKPKAAHLQLYRINLTNTTTENAVPFKFKSYQINSSYFLLLKNFWDITFASEAQPIRQVDYYALSRFGKRLKTFTYLFSSVDGSSDSRKKLFWSFNAGYGQSPMPNSYYIYTKQGFRYRFSPKLDMSISVEMSSDHSNIGLAFADTASQPVVGLRNVRQYTSEISMKLNLSPTTNFTARFRHYNSLIHYQSFYHVDEEGEWKHTPVAFSNGHDENYNLQNVDVFFNWIFRPGSRLVFSYKQWLNDAYLLNTRTDYSYMNNVYTLIRTPHAYELSMRVIFFLDYNEARGHHHRSFNANSSPMRN